MENEKDTSSNESANKVEPQALPESILPIDKVSNPDEQSLILKATSTVLAPSPLGFRNLTEFLKKKYLPQNSVVQKIEGHKLYDIVKGLLRKKGFTIKNIDKLYPLVGDDPNSKAALLIGAIVVEDLKGNGLWKEQADELPVTAAFPKSVNKKFKRNYSEHRDPTDDAPARLHGMDHHEILSRPKELFFQIEMKIHESLQNRTNELMRQAPASLGQSIARQISDDYKNLEDLPIDILKAAYIYSRGMTDEHFEDAMTKGLERLFPAYFLDQYKADRVEFKKELGHFKAEYFLDNPVVLRLSEEFGSDSKTIWKRLLAGLEDCTPKQRHALAKVHMDEERLTRKEAAKDFKISLDSLNDRVNGAIKKIKAAVPELASLKPSETSSSKLTCDLSLNGLWRKSGARQVAPLIRIDPITGLKSEIVKTKKRVRKTEISESLIKAWAMEAAPVPKIVGADFFCGLRPGY